MPSSARNTTPAPTRPPCLTDLAEFTHLVTRLRFVPSAAGDAALSQDERTRGAEFAAALPVRTLARAWQMLVKGVHEVHGSQRPVSAAEMVLIRLAHAADLPTLDEALKALETGETAPRTPAGNGGSARGGIVAQAPASAAMARTRMPSAGAGGQTMRLAEVPRPEMEPAPVAEQPKPAVPVATLADIAALAEANRDLAFKVLLKRHVRPVRIASGHLEVALTPDAPRTLLNDISTNLKKWTGRPWVVSLSREAGGRTLAEEETERRESAIVDARSDPAVAAILARFPGARIIDVRLSEAAADEPEGAADAPPPAPDEDDDDT